MYQRKEEAMSTSTKIALAAFAAATFTVGPALAEGEATTGTTTEVAAAPAGGEAKGGEKEFGNPGVISISGTVPIGRASVSATGGAFDIGDGPTGFSFESTSTKPPGGGSSVSGMSFSLAPTIDYFVAEGISVGGFVGFGYTKAGEDPNTVKVTTIGIGPRVGYNLWLTPGQLSLWPNVWFGYFNASANVGGNDAGSLNKMALGVNVPLLIHPASHFHFGVGPFFRMDVSSKVKDAAGNSADGDKTTAFGLMAEIGGWL
jgi:hypothetical protein